MAERSSDGKRGTFSLFVIAFFLGVAYVVWLASRMPGDQSAASVPTASPPAFVGPTRTLRPTRTPAAQLSQGTTSSQAKVAVVAGHWQSDSGAICPDGLQEVDINLDIASRVVAILQHEGYDAELLPEFSEKLNGYRAHAFVSIHVDSCEVPGASGFKVARVAASAIPEEEDRLVKCLVEQYGKATGLRLHQDSITFDMTEYHAFREIHPQTPGVIIELGFMDADRALLTEHSSDVAQAVVDGIVCFFEGD